MALLKPQRSFSQEGPDTGEWSCGASWTCGGSVRRAPESARGLAHGEVTRADSIEATDDARVHTAIAWPLAFRSEVGK